MLLSTNRVSLSEGRFVSDACGDIPEKICNRLLHVQIQSPEENSEVGFPGGTVVKNPPANAGDTGSSPGPGRSPMPRSN